MPLLANQHTKTQSKEDTVHGFSQINTDPKNENPWLLLTATCGQSQPQSDGKPFT